MRPIKFRSWDKRSRRMEIPDGIANDIDGDKCQVMQYTGLKDSKGKEIYEGDICLTRRFIVKDGKQTRPEHRFAVEPTIESWYKVLCLLSTNNLEVIGNIYEDRGLLK